MILNCAKALLVADLWQIDHNCLAASLVVWNKYRIECVGDSLKISVNGVQPTDFKDSVDAQGYLAIQHHGEKGKIYRFRNIRVKVLRAAKE